MNDWGTAKRLFKTSLHFFSLIGVAAGGVEPEGVAAFLGFVLGVEGPGVDVDSLSLPLFGGTT